jgi:nucleoside-diphosphate-sugar epimerase
MKILVTGGSGTIGGYVLRELLGAGHTVTDYSRTPPRVDGVGFIPGDIMDLAHLSTACAGHEAIIHLAAVPGPGRASPEQLLTINVIGTVNVLEAALRAGINKIVLASSGAATGFSFPKRELTPQYLPLDERHPCDPQDDYGLSKLLAELTCKRYSAAFGLSTLCLRINHNWYLSRPEAELALCSGWAKNFATVEEFWAKRYCKVIEDADGDWPTPGPPAPKNLLWAVTDARDAAQAFRLAVEDATLQHEVFHINGDDTCSLIETPTLIARHYPQVLVTEPLEGFASLVSHTKATRLLNYRPQFTWRVSDFAVWFQRQREAKSGG